MIIHCANQNHDHDYHDDGCHGHNHDYLELLELELELFFFSTGGGGVAGLALWSMKGSACLIRRVVMAMMVEIGNGEDGFWLYSDLLD